MAPDNFAFKLKAAIAAWSIESDVRSGPWMRRLFLSPTHVNSLAEHIMPVVEEIINQAKEKYAKP